QDAGRYSTGVIQQHRICRRPRVCIFCVALSLDKVFIRRSCRIFATAVPLRLQSDRAMVRLAGRTRTRESDSKSGAEKAKDAKETNDRDREGGHGGGPLGPEPRGRGDRPRVPSSACCRPRCSTETK